MRRLVSEKTFFWGALVLLATIGASARADFIATESTTVTRLSPSLYLYSYSVSVAANSTASVSEFDLALNAPINANSIVSPSNFFAFYTTGDPFISFTAFDNGTPFNGIAPGSSGTFSFTSAFGPATASYQVSGIDPNAGFVALSGTTAAPSIVPEPSSLMLLGCGLCGAVGLARRARGRSAATA